MRLFNKLVLWTVLSTSPVLAQNFGPPGGGGGGGSGSVTSVAAGCGGVATPSPITSTGTISALELVNPQVGTTYTVNNADCGNLTTFSNGGAIAVTLPQANTSSQFIAGWFADYQNLGAGTVTITPTTSTINGGATFTLTTGQGAKIVSDGVNYQVQTGKGSSGTVTTVSVATANGVSGSVANPTTTPAITLTLGAITPTTVNGVTIPTTTDTAALLGTAQTFSAANIFSAAGASLTPGLKLTGAIFTGGGTTNTKPQFLVEPTGTSSTAWSNNGTLIGANGASGCTGNLIDLQQAATSELSLSCGGSLTVNGSITSVGGNMALNSSVRTFSINADVILSRKGAANWQLGSGDAASPSAQKLSVQSVIAGTADTAGQSWTLVGSLSTGSGASGDLIFQTGGTGAGSTVQNAAVTALTIKGATSTAGSGGAVITAAAIADSGFGYATPSTGGTVTLANSNYHQIIDPAGTLATLTVNMPPNPINGQFVDVRFSQVITALTVSGNGNSISGNPTSAAVGAQFGCIFRTTNTTWYC